MACEICKEEKLYKEFAYKNLSDDCQHAALFCMECALKSRSTGKCPYSDCDNVIPKDLEDLDHYEAVLECIYPDIQLDQNEALNMTSGSLDNGQFDSGIISVLLLTGERLMLAIHSTMTVAELKEKIEQTHKTPAEKQRLVYNQNELKVHQPDGSLSILSEYGVKPNCSVNLLILLYRVPEHLNHVTFDLHWGYPTKGRDYLDASCLVFNKTGHLKTIDYSSTFYGFVNHSGDLMDDKIKVGHHIMNVNMKEITDEVTHLFFVLSAWNSPTINLFKSPSLNFHERSNKGQNLCSTSLEHALLSEAVVMCSVSRKGGVWHIVKSGKLTRGCAKNYKPIISTIQQMIQSGIC